ncbi:activating signal cointegrator 1 [Macadamia integrifolia]|uniref:activating signal cointegrator 1 n=1 Tax=Macadamia integrifolia TaxID=60698 RepID=UPI001C4ED369|nr:activating signal cointegrator 1 [Macadamia integrifolia]
MKSKGSGEWLEKALLDLCRNMETGLDLDADLISGLVSYCEMAPPQDAKEYLNNIIGEEAGQNVIDEYLRQRGYSDNSNSTTKVSNSKLQTYMKPPQDEGLISGTRRPTRVPKEVMASSVEERKVPSETAESRNSQKVNQGGSKKKKAGKVVSLAEAAKGSIVFQQGKPCSCQARRHKLVSNCLSCGKIVCEQEGEGPCNFCGALVLREGSTYAGLENAVVPLSDAEAEAEAYAKRLVEYDRNAAARTTVIDDQSDYYEFEGNSWLSKEEKDLLKKKQQEIDEAESARRSKVVVTFDLVGRKILMNKDDASELESENRILRPVDEREANRIKPNPTARVQPSFVDPGPGPGRKTTKGKQPRKVHANGLCLEISGRVQHGEIDPQRFVAAEDPPEEFSDRTNWLEPSANISFNVKEEDYECSLDSH